MLSGVRSRSGDLDAGCGMRVADSQLVTIALTLPWEGSAALAAGQSWIRGSCARKDAVLSSLLAPLDLPQAGMPVLRSDRQECLSYGATGKNACPTEIDAAMQETAAILRSPL